MALRTIQQLLADVNGAIRSNGEGGRTTAQDVRTFLTNVLETMQSLLNSKVEKVTGKQLSTEDFTTAEKQKLAEVTVHPATHPASIIEQDANNRFVTEAEKITWNSKQNALGYTPVREGGGVGQNNNRVYVGWATDSSGLKVTVDDTDLGLLAFKSHLNSYVTTAGGTLSGTLKSENQHVLLSKKAGQKSWLFHHGAGNNFYLVPTAVGSEEGDWSNQFEFRDNGALVAKEFTANTVVTTPKVFISGGGSIAADARIGFFTSGSQAQSINVGSVLVSNSYADASKVPVNGMWVKGAIQGSSLKTGDNTTLTTGSASSLRVANPSGYVEIAPQNTGWCHFQTDRPTFYFNKPIAIDGGILQNYGGDGNLKFRNANSVNMSVMYNNGDMWVANHLTAAGNVTAYSDARLKTNINSYENGLEKVMRLKPVTYDRIDTGKFETGFIAQDVENVDETLIVKNSDEQGTLSLDYSRMVVMLTKAVQEQQKQIEELKLLLKK